MPTNPKERTRFAIDHQRLEHGRLTVAKLAAITNIDYNRCWRLCHGGGVATPDEARIVTQVIEAAVAFESLGKGPR